MPVFAFSQAKTTAKFAGTITADDLRKHLTIIAGPEMEGRETATEGQRKAAAYIENYFKSLGLQPGNGGSYQMQYPVYRDSITGASFAVNGMNFLPNVDFSVSSSNYPATQRFGEMVFVNFDDSLWKNNKVDVSGKLVLFRFQGLQGQSQNRMAFGNTVGIRVNSLMAKGAVAALAIQDIFPLARPADPLGNMTMDEMPSRQSINYFNISPAAAKAILGSTDYEHAVADKLSCKTIKAKVEMQYAETQAKLSSSNVLGLLEGTDKKDEYLVITGHYDHLGKRDTVIYYGADDDGSGTVSVLELAEAFVKAKAAGKGPRRSILFMTVSGEEKGLWGSGYYAANPAFPLKKTTANLNIDMVGRIDSLFGKTDTTNYVYVVGTDKLSSELNPITLEANKQTKLHLSYKYDDPKDQQRIYFRSDHYNFAKNGVPIIFYFDGLHNDYHRPTDTVDKIEFDLMARRAQLVFFTAWDIANRPEMLKRDIPLPASALSR